MTKSRCDLLFRQVGCTSSQPEISPGESLPFLTVMHLNLFPAELWQLLNIHHLPTFLAAQILCGDQRYGKETVQPGIPSNTDAPAVMNSDIRGGQKCLTWFGIIVIYSYFTVHTNLTGFTCFDEQTLYTVSLIFSK